MELEKSHDLKPTRQRNNLTVMELEKSHPEPRALSKRLSVSGQPLAYARGSEDPRNLICLFR